MSFAINLDALRERAANRIANAANAASRLTDSPPHASQLAALATSHESPSLSMEQAGRCHAPAWSESEIRVFSERRDRLLRWGYSEQRAESLAERLTLRDREHDDRGTCAECQHGRAKRCPDGGPLPADLLNRCHSFKSAEV